MREQERLIDADRLKRVLIAFFTGAHLELPHISKVIDFLDNAPAIDAVRVVRCKNCIKRGTGDCPKERDFPWIESDSNGFCDEGEEKG